MNPRIPKLCSAIFCAAVAALAANSAFAQSITIMPVGDSITAGFSNQMSWREELDARLAASGCPMLSRGSVEDDGFQQDGNRSNGNGHEGYPGDRADQFINGAGPNLGIGIIRITISNLVAYNHLTAIFQKWCYSM